MADSQSSGPAGKTLHFVFNVGLGIIEVAIASAAVFASTYAIAVAFHFDYARQKFVRPPQGASILALLSVCLFLAITTPLYASEAFGESESPLWLCLLVASVGVFAGSLLLTGIHLVFAMVGSLVKKKLDLLFATTDREAELRRNEVDYTVVPSDDTIEMKAGTKKAEKSTIDDDADHTQAGDNEECGSCTLTRPT